MIVPSFRMKQFWVCSFSVTLGHLARNRIAKDPAAELLEKTECKTWGYRCCNQVSIGRQPDAVVAGCTDFNRLLPDVWKQSHPEAIRQYRVEERRDKAERSNTSPQTGGSLPASVARSTRSPPIWYCWCFTGHRNQNSLSLRVG